MSAVGDTVVGRGSSAVGVPVAEAVRFVTVAYQVTATGFETLGQRGADVTCDAAAARIAIAAASRWLGDSLAVWDSLRPDSVGLSLLAEEVDAGLRESPAFVAFASALRADPLGPGAAAVVASLRAAVEQVRSECAPVADTTLAISLETVLVQLRAAAHALGGLDSIDRRASQEVLSLANAVLLPSGMRKAFSSPLPVPNEQGNNHWTWQ